MYNTGRMWRLRNDPATKADGDIAKKLRNAFVADHCKAVWVPLSDDLDIARLEEEVIRLAPKDAIAWNRRGMDIYEEPTELVDLVIERLRFGPAERAALDRQRMRFLDSAAPPVPPAPSGGQALRAFPQGPFRFVALDVETANHDRASICQIGVACVRSDNSIETWATYIDPQTSRWAFTALHGISKATVVGAPTFSEALGVLEGILRGVTVYQHSGFDRSAIRAACAAMDRPEPSWHWQDSVTVARRAWPELKGNGGHGLASLKVHLGLSFDHHDAGEDARAAAEVVLHAEGARSCLPASIAPRTETCDVIEDYSEATPSLSDAAKPGGVSPEANDPVRARKLIGHTVLTQGNINHNHFYLRDIWDAFPTDCIGGTNAATAACRSLTVRWGSSNPTVTDLDGKKKLFRKRGWVREFFAQNDARVGDKVMIHTVGKYDYEVSIVRG